MIKRSLFTVIASLCCPLYAIVVPSTSAGVVERQIESEYDVSRIPPEKEVPLLEVDIPEKTYSLSDGVKVRICHLELQDNTLLSECEINAIFAPYENQDLSMGQIHTLCLDIQNAYVQKGYILARTYCPEQTIENCTLQIRVLQGVLNRVYAHCNQYYKSCFVENYFAHLECQPIHYAEILKALFLLNENMKLEAGAIFTKGDEVGTVDLIIEVNDQRPINFGINANNYGTDLNTRWRTGARLDYGNLISNGDTLSATQVVGSPINGLLFTNIEYRTPLNYRGAYLYGAYLYSFFKVSELTSLRLKGRTDIGTIRYEQALQRTRYLNTDAFVEFDVKRVENFAQGSTSSLDKLRVLIMGYSADYTDSFRGRTITKPEGHIGIPNFLWGSPSKSGRSSRKGAGGEFVYLALDATRIQGLVYDSFYLLHGHGQYSFYKLPLAEQIYIGGVDTVRGYEPAILLGDSGYYINNEIRTPIPFIADYCVPMLNKNWKDFIHLVGFLDLGQVFLKGGSTFNQESSGFLLGTGVGLRTYGPWGFETALDVSFPLTEKFKTQSPFVYFKVSWNIL
ncbi:MAG: ShlB/FhaC/HecB family hemolysin secretion/activation protein [Simkaniaceae bacterium]|nr:ShlB/FhaC/HecB family hemolysin secretion/activation protein [Candidatus Sacchlamyda saccharinae]